jgi:hypothetical protein
MNESVIEKLEIIKRKIRHNPLRLDMSIWNYDRLLTMDKPNYRLREELQPECNTIGCISGWAQIMFPLISNPQKPANSGEELTAGMHSLGIDDEDIARRLFYVERWEPEYKGAYRALQYFLSKQDDNLTSEVIKLVLEEMAYYTCKQIDNVMTRHIRWNIHLALYIEPTIDSLLGKETPTPVVS